MQVDNISTHREMQPGGPSQGYRLLEQSTREACRRQRVLAPPIDLYIVCEVVKVQNREMRDADGDVLMDDAQNIAGDKKTETIKYPMMCQPEKIVGEAKAFGKEMGEEEEDEWGDDSSPKVDVSSKSIETYEVMAGQVGAIKHRGRMKNSPLRPQSSPPQPKQSSRRAAGTHAVRKRKPANVAALDPNSRKVSK